MFEIGHINPEIGHITKGTKKRLIYNPMVINFLLSLA